MLLTAIRLTRLRKLKKMNLLRPTMLAKRKGRKILDITEDDATENDQSQFGAHFSQPCRSEEEVTVIALNEVFSRRIIDVLCCLGFALMKKKHSDKL
jgi:hypothetical protein